MKLEDLLNSDSVRWKASVSCIIHKGNGLEVILACVCLCVPYNLGLNMFGALFISLLRS